MRPGLWSIPLPIPTGTMRYTNVYALESPDGLTLVDAGWDDAAAWDALGDGLAACGHTVGDVRRVLVTHTHRDHYGQGGRIRRASGATIAMHPREAATLPGRFGPAEVLRDQTLAWLRRSGVPLDEALAMLPRSLTDDPGDMPEPDVLLDDGDRVPAPGWRLRAIWTPGHTPGHLVFVEETHGLLLSGDHVLPRVTPNISVNPRQEADPLAKYLVSLAAVGDLPVDEVLPAHEYRFRGLAARTGQLLSHHERRLRHVLDRAGDGADRTAWEICASCEWARPWSQAPPLLRRLALGETIAHLVVLRDREHLRCRETGGVEVWTA